MFASICITSHRLNGNALSNATGIPGWQTWPIQSVNLLRKRRTPRFYQFWRRQVFRLCTSLATPNASPSTATRQPANGSATSPNWGIRRINGTTADEWGRDFGAIYPDGITAENIFAYTYAVLHNPAYREEYAVDLLREFPRLPLYPNFNQWAGMGQDLLDLHIGFESAEPYPLQRIDKSEDAKRVFLRPIRSLAASRWTTRPPWPESRRTPGAIAWAAGRPWSGCWTNTRSASPRTQL